VADITASVGLDNAEAIKAIDALAARIDKVLAGIGVLKVNVDADVTKAETTLRGARTRFEKAIGGTTGINVAVAADTAPAIKAVRDSAGKFKKAGEEAGASASSGFNSIMSGAIGGALLGGGVAGAVSTGIGLLKDGVTAVFELGQGFETGLASLSAVTGATGAGLDDLGQRARDLAVQFGGSANDQLTVFQTTLSKIGW